MREATQLSVDELLRCFFSECERNFRFLEERYGYHFICGLAEYQKNYKIIKPLNDQKIYDSFSAITRYEKEEHAIEIVYGNEQFLIEAYTFYNPYDRFELSEILTAARRNDEELNGDWGVTNPDLIQKTIKRLANNLQSHARIVLDPKAKLLERAMTIRNTRLEQAIRQKHSDSIENACKDAASAFRKKDYRRVVQLLEPHKGYLKKADIKKLERARKSLLSLQSQ